MGQGGKRILFVFGGSPGSYGRWDERRRRVVISKPLTREEGRRMAVKWQEAETLSPSGT